MEHGEPVLEVKNLYVTFGSDVVLDNLSFVAHKGDVVAIIGPNGAGKTVLFRALLGLAHYSGEIRWADGIKIGYVPQRFGVDRDLPLTVKEFFDLQQSAGAEAIQKSLQAVELKDDVLKKRVGLLSGGMLQRVLIAWALLGDPDVLLIDEPTTSVDVPGTEEIYETLNRLKEGRKLSIFLISHDLSIVFRYAAHVVCVSRSQICFGTAKDILTPENLQKVYGGQRGFYEHYHPNP